MGHWKDNQFIKLEAIKIQFLHEMELEELFESLKGEGTLRFLLRRKENFQIYYGKKVRNFILLEKIQLFSDYFSFLQE